MTEIAAENRKSASGTKSGVRALAVTGVLSAAAFVLQLVEIPVPFLMPTFVKFDFSDLPALLGAFALGPVWGIVIELVKNLLHGLMSTSSFGVGELCNFALGAVFAGTAGLIYRFHKTKKGAVAASLIGAIVMAAVSYPLNRRLSFLLSVHAEGDDPCGLSGYHPFHEECGAESFGIQCTVHLCKGYD